MAAMSTLTSSFIEEHLLIDDPHLAAALTRTAGQLALRMRAEGLETAQKTSVSDVVTQADTAAEQFVVEALAALRPEDGLLGEEGAAKESSSGRTWVIDPVDGTYNFSCGSDYFCSALALVEGDPAEPDRILASAVTRPALDTTWVADGLAASINGTPLPALESAPLEALALATYLHPRDMNNAAIRDSWLQAVNSAATVCACLVLVPSTWPPWPAVAWAGGSNIPCPPGTGCPEKHWWRQSADAPSRSPRVE